MFADACQRVSEFIRPVVVSTRLQNGEVRTQCGTFIVVNRDGWVITAGHLYDSFVKYQTDLNKLREIRELNESRSSRPGAPTMEMKPDPTFITNHSFWWGWDGVKLNNVFVNRQIDIAVGRLEPFDPSWIREYPVFKDPDHLRPGTSICRMGFPFSNVECVFDETANAFRLSRKPTLEAMFPNDGIHSRTVDLGRTKDGLFDRLYVDTSSPGIPGQSGGPIFDSEGRIYAMQASTLFIPLNLHPFADYEGRTVVENQFLNVGRGVHVRTIRQVLESRGVHYDAEGDESGFRIIE